MPEPEDDRDGALGSLDARLNAFDAKRSRRVTPMLENSGAGDGYRILGTLIGGVLAGLGLGWLADHFAGSTPLGLIVGLLIGAGAAIFSIARSAMRTGATDGAAKPRNERKTGG